MYTSAPEYVRTPEELDIALHRLTGSSFVAIDTEFLRERTYYPKFCLLQVAHDDYCAVIDVLALPTLSSLLEFLSDRTRVKVLHAAHQDLEVLALARGSPIAGPFLDTQAAAAFLDMPANIGYADLVQRRLHHTLDKGQSRTDWSQRPLSAAQLSYAADDVIYLAELYHNLRDALHHTPRWNWIEEDATLLEDPKLYATEPTEAWQRLRGLDHLQPEQRAAAKGLAAWREQRAMQKDLPRSWILSDDVLRQLAEDLPTTQEGLGAIKDLARSTVEKRGEELLKLIADARTRAGNEAPASFFRPTRSQQKKVTAMMDFVRKQGALLHVSPERLASRRDVEALIFSGRIGSFGRGWRYDAFGKQLIEIAARGAESPEPQTESN